MQHDRAKVYKDQMDKGIVTKRVEQKLELMKSSGVVPEQLKDVRCVNCKSFNPVC